MAEPDEPTAIAELPDEDLERLAAEARRALSSGFPRTRAIRIYGIEDAEALQQWLAEIDAELARRGLGSSS
jgi:hypothetical protein